MAEPRFAAQTGRRVSLPGRFEAPVLLEDVRPLGADGSVGYECRARRFDDARRDGWGRPVVHRRALYGAWNALANLADLTGKVSVSARAEGALDKAKLENGVLEPLRELKLIDE